jgi:LacI family transcriptional regulator
MNKHSRKLTLEDIGKLAGVSRATASRVINDYPYIKQEVRERVQNVIRETGYRPNKIAQSLASNKSGMIGLVIPHVANTVLTNPYFLHLINSITRATNLNDLTLVLFLFHSMDEEDRIAESIFNTNMVDGVIITADRREDSFVEQIVQHGVPLAFVGKPEPGVKVPYVNVDNQNGGYLATEHLISRDRRKIAAIICNHNTAGEDRHLGYQRALEAYNIPYDERLVAEGDFSLESGYTAMQTLLHETPDAVFVSSDLMAIGAQRAIREAELSVPEDIAMVGFDDLPEISMAERPLTTIRQPVDQLGSVAVELLKEAIDQPASVVEPRVLPVKLVCRET